MRTCDYCGDEIVFRYVDGQRTPIHVNGGRCSGQSTSPVRTASGPFRSVVSYVNPNAHCPVCKERVYFYQSPFGGRVFFDDLGWPWPKHSCTDDPRSQSGTVTGLTDTVHRPFLSQVGQSLTLYELVNAEQRSHLTFLEFRQLAQHLKVFRVTAHKELLDRQDITIKDLRNAPAFVIRFYDDHRLIEFICGRKQTIASLLIPRAQ